MHTALDRSLAASLNAPGNTHLNAPRRAPVTTPLAAGRRPATPTDPSRLWRALGLPSQRAAAPQPIFEPRSCRSFHELVGLHVSADESVLALCLDERRAPAVAARPAGDEAVDPASAGPGAAAEERRLALLLEALGVVAGAADDEDRDESAAADRADERDRVRPLLGFLDGLDRAVPIELDIHLIFDRRASCRDGAVRAWFGERRRFHVHFTTDHRRWRERALTWLRFAARRQRALGAPRSTLVLESAIRRFIRRPPAVRAFTWARSADEILTGLARFLVRRGR